MAREGILVESRRNGVKDKMELADLAFACYIYSCMTDYDRSYDEFAKGTKPEPTYGWKSIGHYSLPG